MRIKAVDEITVRVPKRPSRENTTMIAANFPTPVSLALKALVARLGVERGRRVSVQDGLAEALLDYFVKHGETPPPDLVATASITGPASRASQHLVSGGDEVKRGRQSIRARRSRPEIK
jgi:hypothetical protein